MDKWADNESLFIKVPPIPSSPLPSPPLYLLPPPLHLSLSQRRHSHAHAKMPKDATKQRATAPTQANHTDAQVKAPRELMKYIVPKGFIAIDGTSLTVPKP